jgi:hypothetical protein
MAPSAAYGFGDVGWLESCLLGLFSCSSHKIPELVEGWWGDEFEDDNVSVSDHNELSTGA